MTQSLLASQHPLVAEPAEDAKVWDPAAFAQMAGDCQQRVFRLAFRLTRNHEDAEDAQQDTFLKAYRHLGQFEGRSRFTTWISRIAINEALMGLRKRRDVFHVPFDDALPQVEKAMVRDHLRSPAENPEATYSRTELQETLRAAVARMNPRQRVVFVLRAMEQLSTAETAQILNISTRAVKARLRRARCELRKMLEATMRTPSQVSACNEM